MIAKEIIDDYIRMVRTYSDRGMMIRSRADGNLYDEAFDPERMGREYDETDIPIGWEGEA